MSIVTALSTRSRRLSRPNPRRIFAGVCVGLARYTGINRWVIRAIFAVATIMSGGGAILLYLAAAFIMPEEDAAPVVADVSPTRLRRSRNDRLLTGVCGGLAARLGLDPSVVRLLWVLASLGSLGLGVVVYALMTWRVPMVGEERAALGRGASHA